MDDTTQQLIALGLVAIVIAAELWRRQRKKRRGKTGCDGCDTPAKSSGKKEAPVKFYRRR